MQAQICMVYIYGFFRYLHGKLHDSYRLTRKKPNKHKIKTYPYMLTAPGNCLFLTV